MKYCLPAFPALAALAALPALPALLALVLGSHHSSILQLYRNPVTIHTSHNYQAIL